MHNRLLEILEREVDFPIENKDKVLSDLEEAVRDKKVMVIEHKQDPIGFLTYKIKNSQVFICYCVIYREFRDRFNLLDLRHYFRKQFKGMRYSWKSKRRNRICCVT
jgi:hypothetical protein